MVFLAVAKVDGLGHAFVRSVMCRDSWSKDGGCRARDKRAHGLRANMGRVRLELVEREARGQILSHRMSLASMQGQKVQFHDDDINTDKQIGAWLL